jgi:hypothetical protein
MRLRLALEFLQIGRAAALLVELVLPAFVSALTSLHNGGLGGGKSLGMQSTSMTVAVLVVVVMIVLIIVDTFFCSLVSLCLIFALMSSATILALPLQPSASASASAAASASYHTSLIATTNSTQSTTLHHKSSGGNALHPSPKATGSIDFILVSSGGNPVELLLREEPCRVHTLSR